ncbi:MAG: hypothetical protein IPP71_10280 [Bacteroidetes bacterium]|nr:hypothetical protein [Bacteroidota bacterium]
MTEFNIESDVLIIKTENKNADLFKYVFEHLIKEGELKIYDCHQSLTADDSTTITGKTILWEGSEENPNQASLTFKTSTEELIDFRIIRTNDEFEKLQFGIISFRDLKDELFIEIGPKGHPNNGLFNRVTSGFLQIGERSVELKMIERGGIYEMDISFTKDSAPSLKNLISIVGGDGKDLDKWLPEALTPFNVSVNKLFTKIDLEDEKRLTYTHCQLEFMDGKSWSLFPQNSAFSELLKVGELWIRLEVDHPLDPAYRFTTVALGGNIILGNPLQPGRIQLEARWPDLAISGQLKKGDTIELAWLLKKIGLPVAGPSTGEQTLRISQLTFCGRAFHGKKIICF